MGMGGDSGSDDSGDRGGDYMPSECWLAKMFTTVTKEIEIKEL